MMQLTGNKFFMMVWSDVTRQRAGLTLSARETLENNGGFYLHAKIVQHFSSFLPQNCVEKLQHVLQIFLELMCSNDQRSVTPNSVDLSARQLQCSQACWLLCSQTETQIVTFHWIEAPYLCLNALHDKWQQINAVGKPESMKVVTEECGLTVIHIGNVGTHTLVK